MAETNDATPEDTNKDAQNAVSQNIEGSSLITNKKVPSGFLSLLRPETNAVDIYFGGEYVVTTIAKFNPNFVEFLVPEEIVNNIPHLKEKQTLFRNISVPQSPNADKLCGVSNKNDCGLLKPDIVGVIFNSATFRADIFINPILLFPADELSARYLAPSKVPYSYVNNLSVTGTGDDRTDDNYNLSGQSILAHKQNRIQMLWDYADETEATVDSLSYQLDRLGMEYEAGYFSTKSKSVNFIPDTDILGIKIGTTLKTRTDLESNNGSDIFVFFSNRSRVEVYRKDNLIDVQFYDVGNQEIDTSNFPEGAYDIELRITDVNGRETIENHFFAKSARLPPEDSPQLALEVGRVTELAGVDRVLPSLNESALTRVSFQQRVTPDLGLEGSVSMFTGQGHIEGGIVKLGPSYQIASGLLASGDDDLGASFDLRHQYGNFSNSLGLRRIYSRSSDPLAAGPSDTYDPILASSTNFNVSVSYQSPYGNLNGQFIRRRQENENASETYLARYQRSILAFSDSVISLNAEAGKVRDVENEVSPDIEVPVDKEFYSIGLQVNFVRGHWTGNASSNYREDLLINPNGDGVNEQESGAEYALEANWNDQDILVGDLEGTLFARNTIYSDVVGLGVDYESYLGRSDFIVQETSSGGRESQQWSANLGFAVVGNTETIAFGGQKRGDSAIIAEIDGEAEGAYFDVLVNGYERGSLGIGRKNIIGLAPYDVFDVSLKPKGDSFINFRNENKRTVLYPGNVVHFKWSANQVYLIYGRVLDKYGNVIPNAKITDLPSWSSSDDYGIFQTEIYSDTSVLRFETHTHRCSVDLPAYTESEGIVSIGDLICDMQPKAELR